ncbi:hypothetical protein LX36DRAFT_588024 [Colletotrichum falcatum]|nr:hypothetical protein LX36DRAFT_588024 [Colletotrichum falcatum]
MADEEQAVQRPAQIYQTPEWETPVANKRRSLFDRLVAPSALPNHRTTSAECYSKENNASTDSHHAYPAAPAAASVPEPHASLRARFDALLPPHKTYAGLSRKRFLLFVVLPLALLVLLVLPLALGLGLSKRRGGGLGNQDLPLPADGEAHTGDLTYYAVGLGACGRTDGDGDAVVSVSHYLWDAVQTGGDPNGNPLCGRRIRVRRRDGDGGGSVDVTVVDRCTGCEPTDLDLSPAVFERLADKGEGRVKGTWSWLD